MRATSWSNCPGANDGGAWAKAGAATIPARIASAAETFLILCIFISSKPEDGAAAAGVSTTLWLRRGCEKSRPSPVEPHIGTVLRASRIGPGTQYIPLRLKLLSSYVISMTSRGQSGDGEMGRLLLEEFFRKRKPSSHGLARRIAWRPRSASRTRGAESASTSCPGPSREAGRFSGKLTFHPGAGTAGRLNLRRQSIPPALVPGLSAGRIGSARARV